VTTAGVMQVMKSMPRIDESRKRKAEGGPSYGKKSKADPSVCLRHTITAFMFEVA